jgi:mRNA-degrading endonuclease toxin of MazEF toxin-antitoxin module
MEIGDIYLVELSSKKGREQQRYRPAILVVTHTDVTLSMIVPLTTTSTAKKFNNTIEIKPDKDNHLAKISIALLFQLTTVYNKLLKKKIGKLNKNDIDKILQSIKKMF